MATLEEASRCPKCQEVGDQGAPQRSNKPGVNIIPFTCKNERCRWYNTAWLVQVNPDGTIPDPSEVPRGPKQFDRPDKLLVARNMEQVNAMAELFQARSTEH